ncbi:MAG: nucleotidyltransferase family protein [Hyphomonadaceae bacterium]
MIPDKLGIIMLASGLSTRFGTEDKLLAPLNRKPVASHAASLFASYRTGLHCSVVPETAPERTNLFSAQRWTILNNPSPELGQGASIAIAARHLLSTDATASLILLADMPFVTENYLSDLIEATPNGYAAMSQSGSTSQPPALFPRAAFHALADCSGDTGARGVFTKLSKTALHPISPDMARDIDTLESLNGAQESSHHA